MATSHIGGMFGIPAVGPPVLPENVPGKATENVFGLLPHL